MTSLLLLLLTQSPSLTPTVVRPANGSFATRPAPDAGAFTVTPPPYLQSAFGPARVVLPYTLLDSEHLYPLRPEEWATRVTLDSGVTHLPNESAVLLSANADGGVAAIRTNGQFRYQAGKGGRVIQTATLPGLTDGGQVYRWGYYDDDDGLGWLYSASGLKFFVRSSVDGGVPSETHYAVDAGRGWVPANGSIYEMAFQWLGVGTVTGYLNGATVVSIPHANALPSVYMKTAFLPVTYEATAGSGPAHMKAICSTVQSEGGAPPVASTFSERRQTDLTISGSTANAPVIAVRVAPVYGGQRSRVQVVPTRVWCSADSKRVRIDVIYNPATLTGATFTSADTYSGVQFDVAATAYTGGTSVGSFGVSANTSQDYELGHVFGGLRRQMTVHPYTTPINDGGFDAVGMDTLLVVASNPGAGNAAVVCGIDWEEVQ